MNRINEYNNQKKEKNQNHSNSVVVVVFVFLVVVAPIDRCGFFSIRFFGQ